MKHQGIKKLSLLFLGLLLLGGCTTDPNKRKLKYLVSGERYAQRGNYREAAIEFRNAVQIDPKFAEGHYQLGMAYLSLHNPEAAYREVKEAVSLDPANSGAQLQVAILHMAHQQYDQAQAAAEKVLAADPKNSRAHEVLAEKYVATRDLPKALREFQTAIALNPQRVETYAALGAIYLLAGQPAEAEAAYKNAAEVNPKSLQARMTLGQYYFSHGKMAEAEAAAHAACGLDPHAVPPRLFLAQIDVVTGKLADAENVCKELKTIAPDNPEAYQALGLHYLSLGQKEKAVAEFQSLLASRPKDSSVKNHLVETLLDLNRVPEARKLNQEILSANRADPQGLLSDGRILLADGRLQEALAQIEKAVKAEPKSARNQYFLGLAQRSAGLPAPAKASFALALQLDPRMTDAAVNLAQLEVRSGEYDDALRLADGALKINPNLPFAYLAREEAWEAKGDARQAEATLLAALDHDPVSLPVLARLLRFYQRQGKTQVAVERISGLVKQYPQNAGLHFLLGLGYFNLKDLEKAEASIRQALALDPKTLDAHTMLADIDLAKGNVEDAKAELRAAIEANPSSVPNYQVLEIQYEKEGNWEEAKKLCEKAHQVDPASPRVALQLAHLYLEHGGDVNVALPLAQMAKQKMPDSPLTADTLGWAYYKFGSAESAITELKEAVQRAPHTPIFEYHLGMAYVAGGHSALAREALQSALKDNPKFPQAADAAAALQKLSKARQ